MNSQSNHCGWDALLGLGKPNSKNLFRVRRKGVVLKKNHLPGQATTDSVMFLFLLRRNMNNARNMKLFPPQKKDSMKNAANTSTHKNEEGRITALNTRKRHDGEHEYRTNITKLTLDQKKNLPKFQYTLPYWKYYMCMFSLEYGWQWYNEKVRTE